jgi:hypothetical protein
MHAVMQGETVEPSVSPPALTAKEPLQVRIPVSVKRRFKALAALRGMEPNALFVEIWDHYERTQPGATATKDA